MITLIFIVSSIYLIYLITISYVIRGWLKIPTTKQLTTSVAQKVSVVIAYRSEAKNIINCLNAFEKQTLNKADFELILVNDHSEDNSKMLIENFRKTSQLLILTYDLVENTSKKEALTLGIKNASHPIIACTDADCEVPENWIKNIAISFNDNTAMLLGPVVFSTNKNSVSIFQELDMLAIQGITFGMLQHQQPILNNGANIAFLKSDFDLVGGFDKHNTPSGDDIFLLEKFKSKNLTIKGLLAKNHIVATSPQANWNSFMQQRLRWASKSSYYSDKNLIYFSSVVYVSNLIQILIYLRIALVDSFTTIGIILLFSKWLIDFILLYLAAKFFDKTKVLKYVIAMQIIYPFYVVFIGLLSALIPFNWKERKYK